MQVEWGHILIEGGVISAIVSVVVAPVTWASVKVYLALKESRLHSHREDDDSPESKDNPLKVRGIRYSRIMNGD